MRDARIEKLAHNLINYSVKLGAGEKVLIENFGVQKRISDGFSGRSLQSWRFPVRFLKKNHKLTAR